MSSPWRGVVVRSAPAVLLAGLLLGHGEALASVSASQKTPSDRAPLTISPRITTTWTTGDLTDDAFENRALPGSGALLGSNKLPASSERSATGSTPLIMSPDFAHPTDALLGAIPPTYRPGLQPDGATDDPATAALSKPKVEESLVVPIPAFGAGWALILGAGMYQLGARALRLRR